jgi:hypothetical protein
VVQAAEADVVGPAVAAEHPEGFFVSWSAILADERGLFALVLRRAEISASLSGAGSSKRPVEVLLAAGVPRQRRGPSARCALLGGALLAHGEEHAQPRNSALSSNRDSWPTPGRGRCLSV